MNKPLFSLNLLDDFIFEQLKNVLQSPIHLFF